MNPAESLLGELLSRVKGGGGGGGPILPGTLREIVARLRALRRRFQGLGVTEEQRQGIMALSIACDPALDDAYHSLLCRRRDLARRSLPEEVFPRLIGIGNVLASIAGGAGPLALGLLQVVADAGAELREGNGRLLSTMDNMGPQLWALLPGVGQDRLRMVFQQVLDERARQQRKAPRPEAAPDAGPDAPVPPDDPGRPRAAGGSAAAAAAKKKRKRTGPGTAPLLPPWPLPLLSPASPRPSSPFHDGSPLATLLPLDALKQVRMELEELGGLLNVVPRTVTARSDPWVAFALEQRGLALLIAEALEINQDVAPLGPALGLTPPGLNEALLRQSEAFDGYQLADELRRDGSLWERAVVAARFLARSQVRSAAQAMLSDGSLDEDGKTRLVQDLGNVHQLERWTLMQQQRHQQELEKIRQQAGALAERLLFSARPGP